MSVRPALATDLAALSLDDPTPSDEHCPAARPPKQAKQGDQEDDFDDTYGEMGRDGEGGRTRPYFFPPLWLARRTACVEVLRREGVHSVADLGCGSGSLLSILSLPAYTRDDFPSLYPPTPGTSLPSSMSSFPSTLSPPQPQVQTRHDKLSLLRSVPRPPAEQSELHLRKLVGVDLDPTACRKAAQACRPPEKEEEGGSRWKSSNWRWEELRAEVYSGAVEVYNEALEGVEAIVLTEVIEHLTPSALARLPSLLFSVYSPRLIILTTPNHSFNPYFPSPSSGSPSSSPAASEEESHRHPDPTGRTSRIFRDATHTLEFTPNEFRALAEQWQRDHAAEDYDLSFSGVGSLSSYYSSLPEGIPFPPPSAHLHPALSNDPFSLAPPADPSTFFATQIAIFRRRYSHAPERSPRSARPTPLPFFTGTPPASPGESAPGGNGAQRPGLGRRQSTLPLPHKLVVSHVHAADPAAGRPVSLVEVLEEVRSVFREEGRGELSLAEVWRVGGRGTTGGGMSLREMAGGEVGTVVEALVEADALGGGDEGEGEWEFRLAAEGGEGRRPTGMDALLVRWMKYVPRVQEPEEGGEQEQEQEQEDAEEEEVLLDLDGPAEEVVHYPNDVLHWGSSSSATIRPEGEEGAAIGSGGWGDDGW
ncbi:hypothetical protein JCM5296_000858 [Sporobolomyces johnsonii]